MKLTKEAKIYLVVKVMGLFWIDSLHIKYKDGNYYTDGSHYNPHEIEGAKYLRDLVNCLTEEQRDSVADEFEGVELLDDWKGWTPFTLNNLDILCEAILNATGYKGKVWEE